MIRWATLTSAMLVIASNSAFAQNVNIEERRCQVGELQDRADAQMEAANQEQTLFRDLLAPQGVDQGEVDSYLGALEEYTAETREYRATARAIAQRSYNERRSNLLDQFRTSVRPLEGEIRRERAEAIEEFELFLNRYPRHPRYTPDVLQRLAILEFEQSEDEYQAAFDGFDEQERRYQLGLEPDQPTLPRRNFNDSIAAFQRLVDEYPNSSAAPQAFHALGAMYDTMNDVNGTLESFTRLVKHYPDNENAQEAWLRLGEVYFQSLDYDKARQAYGRAYEYGVSEWFDQIVFRKAVSEFFVGDLEAAVSDFIEVLDYYDATGIQKEGKIYIDSIRFLALSLADLGWTEVEDETLHEVDARVARYLSETRFYTLDALDVLSCTFASDFSDYRAADKITETTLERYPLDRDNPVRHEGMFLTYQLRNDLEGLGEEVRDFASSYGQGRNWYNEQQRLGNLDRIAYAERVARSTLLSIADELGQVGGERLRLAQQNNNRAEQAEARAQIARSIQLAEDFIDAYPNDTMVYQAMTIVAAGYFNNQEYAAAGEAYAALRDSDLSDEFDAPAGRLSAYSYQMAVEEAVEAGDLPRRAIEFVDDEQNAMAEQEAIGTDDARSVPEPMEIPELVRAWADSQDRFVELGLENEEEPELDYLYRKSSADTYYSYRHYDEAADRYEGILEEYCGHAETGRVAVMLLRSLQRAEKYDALEYWISDLRTREECLEGLTVAEREEIEGDMDSVIGDIREGRAYQLRNEGQYEEAAEEYLAIALDEEVSDNAARFIYLAGEVYMYDLMQYDKATEQFARVADDFPESEFAPRALQQIVRSSNMIFDFDQSIQTYLTMDERGVAPTGSEVGAAEAAAQLMRLTQQYERASDQFEGLVERNSTSAQAPLYLFLAAKSAGQANNHQRQINLTQTFRRNYSNRRSNDALNIDTAIVELLLDAASSADALGQESNGDRYRRMAQQEFDARLASLPDDSERWQEAFGLRYRLGELEYERLAEAYREWDAILDPSDQDNFEDNFEEQNAARDALAEEMLELSEYAVVEWNVCRNYLLGKIYSTSAANYGLRPVPDLSERYPNLSPAEIGQLMGQFIPQFVQDIQTNQANFLERTMEFWQDAEGGGRPVVLNNGLRTECANRMLEELSELERQGEAGESLYPVYRESMPLDDESLTTPQSFSRPVERMTLEEFESARDENASEEE